MKYPIYKELMAVYIGRYFIVLRRVVRFYVALIVLYSDHCLL